MPDTSKQKGQEPSLIASPLDNEVSVCSGVGACSKSGCNCKGYEGNADTCANPGCGHGYTDHW